MDAFFADTMLTFVIYPQAILLLPLFRLWTFLFFSMIFSLSGDTLLIMIETIVCDTCVFLKIPSKKSKISLVYCVIMICMGLIMTYPGGIYILTLFAHHAGDITALSSILFGTMAISIYGELN